MLGGPARDETVRSVNWAMLPLRVPTHRLPSRSSNTAVTSLSGSPSALVYRAKRPSRKRSSPFCVPTQRLPSRSSMAADCHPTRSLAGSSWLSARCSSIRYRVRSVSTHSAPDRLSTMERTGPVTGPEGPFQATSLPALSTHNPLSAPIHSRPPRSRRTTATPTYGPGTRPSARNGAVVLEGLPFTACGPASVATHMVPVRSRLSPRLRVPGVNAGAVGEQPTRASLRAHRTGPRRGAMYSSPWESAAMPAMSIGGSTSSQMILAPS